MHRWRYIEGIGDGINRVVYSIKNHPLKPKMPDFREDTDQFDVILFAPEVQSIREYDLLSKLKTNEAIVYQTVKKNSNIKMAELIALTGLGKDSVYRALKSLINSSLVLSNGVGKATRYTEK